MQRLVIGMLLKIKFTVAEDDHALVITDAEICNDKIELLSGVEFTLLSSDFFNKDNYADYDKHFVASVSESLFTEEELSKLDFGDLTATGFIRISQPIEPKQLIGCYLD